MKKLLFTLTLMVAVTTMSFAYSFTVHNTNPTSGALSCVYTVTQYYLCNTGTPQCCNTISGSWAINPGTSHTFNLKCSGSPSWSTLSVTVTVSTCNAFTFGNASAGPVTGNCISCTDPCNVTLWDRNSNGDYNIHSDIIVGCRTMTNHPKGNAGDGLETNPELTGKFGVTTNGEELLKESNNNLSYLENFPNPVSQIMNINFELVQDADIVVSVFDLTGKQVMTLKQGVQSKGRNTIKVDVSSLVAGTYSYSFKAGDAVLTRKFIIIK